MARAKKRFVTDLEGTEDLEEAIRWLGEDLQGEILREAVDGGAEIVRDVMGQLAPKSHDGSHGHEPGFLSRNIVKERQWTRSQDQAATHVGPSKEAWYGRFPELGTIYQPAQPFMRPAFDETKDSVVDEIGERLRNRILRRIG